MSKKTNKPTEEAVEHKPVEAKEAVSSPSAEERASFSEKKKRSLLIYMALMLFAAFVMVSVSLLAQINSSKNTISQMSQNAASALANAEALQDNNRALQEENKSLKEQLDQLHGQHQQLSSEKEALQENEMALKKALEQEKTKTESTQKACEALAQAVMAAQKHDTAALTKSMNELESLKEYLSESGKALFDSLKADPSRFQATEATNP